MPVVFKQQQLLRRDVGRCGSERKQEMRAMGANIAGGKVQGKKVTRVLQCTH